ncbi:MAG TPA: MBL fold metallo-hydrolase, partial [Acetobacteraceae bacterium]|nr:MBL fold metallo-hydrolase [Acetobacteraceae bacterium]
MSRTMNFLAEAEPSRGALLPVLPGITRLVAPNPGPMTYWGTNTYLIDSPEGALVLDPGPASEAHVARILEATAGRIAAIILTHSHQDHIGALAALRAATGAPVHAWHSPADPAAAPDVPLSDGDRVGPWQALHTPGHAPDHLCFLGPGGVLFSGDHVMGWSTSVVGPPGGSMADYFASLERLLGVNAATYLPGHGPALTRPQEFVRDLLEHRR